MPVIIALREIEQMGPVTNAFEKRVPFVAIWSRFGVDIAFSP